MFPQTFEGHMGSCFQEESSAFGQPFLPDVVAQGVTPVLLTAEAQSFVESVDVIAPVSCALLVLVQQRVDEQMNRPLMGTFHSLSDA